MVNTITAYLHLCPITWFTSRRFVIVYVFRIVSTSVHSKQSEFCLYMNQEIEPELLEEKINACRILVGKTEEKNHLEDLGVDGRMSLKWTLKNWDRGMEWIDLTQDRDKWRAVVNAVMGFRFHTIRGVSWLAEVMLHHQEGQCSMELVS